MPDLPCPSAVVFVHDLHHVTRFYRALASMDVVHEDDVHVVLGLAGFELVVHLLRHEPPVVLDERGLPPVREDCYLKVCLPVASIAAARDVAAANGGRILPPDREWESRGVRACEGWDPEGNVLQVRQAAG